MDIENIFRTKPFYDIRTLKIKLKSPQILNARNTNYAESDFNSIRTSK